MANAVALNPAVGKATNAPSTRAVANVGWDRWTPVNAAAIGVHLVGSIGQLGANVGRVHGQRGVASMAALETAATAAALGVTAYSRVWAKVFPGTEMSLRAPEPARMPRRPRSDVASAQRQLFMLHRAVPALIGVVIVISSFAGSSSARPRSTRACSVAFAGSTPDSLGLVNATTLVVRT